MASPVSIGTGVLGAISIGSSILGGAAQAAGAQESAAATANMYQYKAGVALINKQINEQNARWALDAGDIQAEESGLRSRSEISQTKANQAASGLDVNSGSAVMVRDSQQKVAAFDQNVIRWDAAKTAYGYETKAMTDEAESNLDIMAGKQVRIAGTLGVASSFINTAGTVASKWMQAKSVGMFSGSDSSGSSFDASGNAY